MCSGEAPWGGRAGTVPRTLVGSLAGAVLVVGTMALLPGDPELPGRGGPEPVCPDQPLELADLLG